MPQAFIIFSFSMQRKCWKRKSYLLSYPKWLSYSTKIAQHPPYVTKRDHSNERFKLPSLLSVLWNYPCKYNILFGFSRSIKYILSNFTGFQSNSDPIEIRIVTQQVQRFISAQIFFQYFTMWLLNAWRLPFLLPSKCLDRKYVPSWRIIQLRGRSH